MGIKKIKQNIEVNNKDKKEKLVALEAIRKEITEEIKLYANRELERHVKNSVKNNPEHTKELGKETLSEMKDKLFSVLEMSDQIVDETFGDDKFWLHVNYPLVQSGDTFGQRYNNTKKAAENIELGIKLILGEAGSILIDYKYAKAGLQRDRTVNEWQIISNDKVMYGYRPSIPESLAELIKQYLAELENLHDLVDETYRLNDELLKQEALELWDEA